MYHFVFATNNQHKIQEIKAVLGDAFSIQTLKEAGINIDIPEPHDTLEANALEKALTIYQLTQQNCFSEDTGLEVTALNGAPGVHSARYAGEDRAFDKNINKLLHNLESATDRSARFRTVIALILDGNEHLFEGICPGTIIAQKKGNAGFGYDPVFIPDGSDRTFGEMSLLEKSHYSHRTKALNKLIEFLQNL